MASQEIAVERRPSNKDDDGDEDRLAQFGYKQELKRDWGLAHNFGVSFSIIVSKLRLRAIGVYLIDIQQSVITGITTLFSYGLNTGGPAGMFQWRPPRRDTLRC
jgi:hypothetical protein